MKTVKEIAEQIYYRRTQMNALDAKDEELIEYFADLIKDYSDQQNAHWKGVSDGKQIIINELDQQNKELRDKWENDRDDCIEKLNKESAEIQRLTKEVEELKDLVKKTASLYSDSLGQEEKMSVELTRLRELLKDVLDENNGAGYTSLETLTKIDNELNPKYNPPYIEGTTDLQNEG